MSKAPNELTAQDLYEARKKVSFPVKQLTLLIYGNPEFLEKRQRVLNVIQNDPTFRKEDRYFLGRTERIERTLEMSRRYVELMQQKKWDEEEIDIARVFIDEYMPITLHTAMFMPVISSQGTEEQVQKWIPPSKKHQIIGCYAQTELAHGSNLSGLETTATFIKETDEFELHSPTITSSKWWIGGLGVIATHAVVQAKLILNGKDYGPHPFVVPIRSLENHEPLPGITVGDIGPKLGFAGIDNGFVRFNRYRIPRENMLMRFSKVDREGKYYKPPHDKLSYGGMVIVRVLLTNETASTIARSAVIATRYCTVRRQFVESGNSKAEANVIGYTMVQYRLFPIIAYAYAMLFTGRWINEMNDKLTKGLEKGDVSLLPEVHAVSSALKSYGTGLAADSIEEGRKVCGGHGYSQFSGLPYFFVNYVATNTYEGENFILTQQTSRFLLKEYRRARQQMSVSKLAPNTRYLGRPAIDPTTFKLEKCGALSETDFLNPVHQLHAFSHRSARQVHVLAKLVDEKRKSWSDVNVECAYASHAHSQYIVLNNFIQALERIRSEQPALYPVMKRLCDLYALITIEKELGGFTEDGFISETQSGLVKGCVRGILKELRPDVIGLVDAFDYPDFLLNSALGRYDGKVYESLYNWAQKEPLNQSKVNPGYAKHIRPMIKAGRL